MCFIKYRVCKNTHIMQYRYSRQQVPKYSIHTYVLMYRIIQAEFRQEKALHQLWQCAAQHTSSADFFSVFCFFCLQNDVFFYFLGKPQQIIRTICFPQPIFKSVYVKVSPRKTTSKEQCAAKHNATANWVHEDAILTEDHTNIILVSGQLFLSKDKHLM